jgi:hypothetical protein
MPEAAKALRLVATERDVSVEPLVGVLDEASGHLENKVARAALSDTRAREKALAVLAVLAETFGCRPRWDREGGRRARSGYEATAGESTVRSPDGQVTA